MVEEPEPTPASALAAGLTEVVENMQPMVEAATGFKAKLESQGWSPTAAETAALTFLVGMIQKSFS